MSNEGSEFKEKENDNFFNSVPKSRRILMYREMKSLEPRMWLKEHHWVKMVSTVLGVNLSIYGLWRLYYNYYIPSLGLFDSVINSPKAKSLIAGIIILNIGNYWLNTYYLYDTVYKNFYEKLSDDEFFEMYESLLRKSKQKEKY